MAGAVGRNGEMTAKALLEGGMEMPRLRTRFYGV